MCGIAGIIAPGLPPQEIRHLLKRMTDTLIHRGPDDEGFFVADGVGLGMRRLSIIDVAGGQQPVSNEDGAVQVVCNGEIYNHLELRSGLRERGHTFGSHSDVEVIAHAYEEKGSGCLDDLRGMYGLALWDKHARQLLLARDRLGKKPLFYSQQGGRLLFASEIKALLAADPSLAEPNEAALLPYFQYGFVPEPETMFRRIHKLPAATWLRYENGNLDIAPYWQLDFDTERYRSQKLEQIVEELDALLTEAVRIRLMSEVPLGVFLSGGLDSSAIVAYAARAGLRPLKTFTVGFDRPGWDESADAEVVARHYGTEHHVLPLNEQDLVGNLPETVQDLVRHFDEPFGDSSSLPTYFISKLARQHVTVILGGDGGDELFAGYSSYRGIRFAESYRQLPGWLGKGLLPSLAQSGSEWLPSGRRYGALRAAKVLRDSSLPFETMYFSKGALCSDELLGRLLMLDLNGGTLGSYPSDILQILQSDLPVLSKASYADLRFRLLNDMLVKVDRMSMAHSLEVRSPLLDHRLVEFAARLPPSLKLRGWQTKAIFRDTVRPYLPPQTLRKRKQGFSVPLREWLRNGLHEMVSDYLEGAGGRLPQGMFDAPTVSHLLSQHRKGEADHSSVIWLLLNYAVWHDTYIRQSYTPQTSLQQPYSQQGAR